MPTSEIFVIGASSGGVDTLQKMVSQLPPDFPGALFVVLHMLPRSKSYLPEILSRAGPLKAINPESGAKIENGVIYVAPPDRHLIVARGHLHLSAGPKEQHQRPCINVLFRSAALAYGDRVTAAVLTGELDDGTAGCWEVKRRGGVVVVQNPEEAAFPSMPLSALREMAADYVVSAGAIGELFTRLARNEGEQRRTSVEDGGMEPQLTDLTCPDCRGTIWVSRVGNGQQFRCRVGHTFSPMSMLSGHSAVEENALYTAIVRLEEGASLATRLASDFDVPSRERLLQEAREREKMIEDLRKMLRERSPVGA